MKRGPEGWARVAFRDVCRLWNGRAYTQEELLPNGKYRVLRVGNLFTNKEWYYSDLELEDQKYIDTGDLIYAWSASFGPRIWNGGKVIYHYHIWKCELEERVVEKAFLYSLLLWDTARIKAQQGVGTTMMHVTKAGMEARTIDLPPLSEQRRIVSKLDSLFARSTAARNELNRIPLLIDHYKQAILEKAFTGELTAGWRQRFYGTNSLTRWDLRRVDEIADVASGQTPKGIVERLESSGAVPWFKVSSMNDPRNQNRMLESEFRLSEASARVVGLTLYPEGTIIFPKRGGAIATNKKRRLGLRAGVDLNLMCLVPAKVVPDFLWWWINSIHLAHLSNGSNIPQINHGDIEPLPIRLPPEEEQKEIVRRLEKAWAWLSVAQLERRDASNLLDRLDQALLTKAFRGELVPQDLNDESAEQLLERIRAFRLTVTATGCTRLASSATGTATRRTRRTTRQA